MTSNTTIVTPNLLLNFLTSPSIIGQSNPNDGYFKEIHSDVIYSKLGSTSITNDAYIKSAQIESVIGECQADYNDIIKGTAIDKVISPAILQSVFNEPPIIGLTQANNALFTNIDANSISGNVIADLTDIYGSTTVNNKLITPITLTNYLTDIKQDIQGQEAKFTKVVSTFSGQLGDLHDSYEAYTDNLYANYINGSVISTLLEVQNGNEERKVINPVILKVSYQTQLIKLAMELLDHHVIWIHFKEIKYLVQLVLNHNVKMFLVIMLILIDFKALV